MAANDDVHGGRATAARVILDRRQEPRFPLQGRFRCAGPPALHGHVLDLSLNGALLECNGDAIGEPGGERLEFLIELPETGSFAVEARVAHREGMHIGIEFQEIQPEAFERLSELVLQLKRRHALDEIEAP